MKNLCSAAYQFVYEIARRNNLYEFAHLTLSWISIVGTIMVEKSKLIKFEHSVLFVKVANHTWLQEFVISKQHILDLLHQNDINYVKDIIFFI